MTGTRRWRDGGRTSRPTQFQEPSIQTTSLRLKVASKPGWLLQHEKGSEQQNASEFPSSSFLRSRYPCPPSAPPTPPIGHPILSAPPKGRDVSVASPSGTAIATSLPIAPDDNQLSADIPQAYVGWVRRTPAARLSGTSYTTSTVSCF
jgi:hypothetical protein